MRSIFEVSKRTAQKILRRLNIECSNCGWNKAPCDIHHIVHKAKGGSDDHSNLSYLCPNCHRLAHYGKITEFITLAEQIGDKWKDCYQEPTEAAREAWRKSIKKNRQERLKVIHDTFPQRLKILKESGIDFSKRGWPTKAAQLVNMAPQSVRRWVQHYHPELLLG